MYDFMLFPRTMKGSRPLEMNQQHTCREPRQAQYPGPISLLPSQGKQEPASLHRSSLRCMFYTGAEMNPARSFTPAMFKRSFMNHWAFWVGPMICGSMGAVMYDFMLFPRMRSLAERVATLKGRRPPEQNPCGELIKLKTQSLYHNPATKSGEAVANQTYYCSPLLPTIQIFSSQQSSSPPTNFPTPRHQQPQLSKTNICPIQAPHHHHTHSLMCVCVQYACVLCSH
ncbi:uncharacterized protein LOC134467613 [Engraulis encrasicolus]|uniref:uncharacterized protein LOC134467613 n=1 Tax=Engraulis encrasicolus TaxID=184585 RepID=UPI002FD0ABA9